MTRFTVVIPTHERREVVARNVVALAAQTERDFEVIVVDDGATDGTAVAVRALEVDFPLTVIEQRNQGAAAARNAGAQAAAGEYLLFLDDDMEADPGMLSEHLRSHRSGADIVLGDMPLHPRSPRNLLSEGVGLWARTRRERLTAPGAELELDDMLTGQLSISHSNYDELGGFDQHFTRDGMFGGEDIDFGYRAFHSGLKLVFNPDAISYQYYDVDPAAYLLREYETGRSDYELSQKHPDGPERRRTFSRPRDRIVFGIFGRAPDAVRRAVGSVVAARVRRGSEAPRLRILFFLLRTAEHDRGFRDARRASTRRGPVVLAYHAIADHGDDRVLRRYSVPRERFARQLDALRDAGWTFVDASAVLAAVRSECVLPGRAVLVTFDDAYTDFRTEALPELRARGIPSVVFALSERVGAGNDWDQAIGARAVPLMDASALRSAAAAGVEIGSHGRRHVSLAKLDPAQLVAEMVGSADGLSELGLPRPRLFAYPYGERTPEAVAAARAAGYVAAFTIDPEFVVAGADAFLLPRLMVMRGFSPVVLRLRLLCLRFGRVEWLERAFEIVGTRQ